MNDNCYQMRYRTKNEATGMRVVSQFVQEFWECGWQPLDARNDQGIDGIIFMKKKGTDLGVRINVQVKCGAKYISSIKEDEIRISIDDAFGLRKHIEYWKTQLEPAILVFVNPSRPKRDKNGNICKDKEGNIFWIENRLKSKAWWVNLKDDFLLAEGYKTIIKIPFKNQFGEHSKGDFLRLIKPQLNDSLLPPIVPNEASKKLLYSINLKKEARDFYKNWDNPNCEAIKQKIRIARTGWRHIVLSRRGRERRINSLKLLGIAKQIIETVDRYYLLSQKENDFGLEQKIGIRAMLKDKYQPDSVVQVVLLRRMSKISKVSKWWFYSIHYRR
jgi:Domain of unknown function (DUF4365)